jgi:hypothetical protein
MQRRAAAVSAAVFLLVAAGAYASIGAVEAPAVDVEAAETLSPNETITVDDRTYTLSSVTGSAATFARTNESARYTDTLANNSTVTYQEESYRVLAAEGDDQFTLEETLNVTQILRADPDVENELLTGDDGRRYVRYTDESTELLDEYLPDPERVLFAEGDEYPHENTTTTVTDVTPEAVTLAWTAPRTTTVQASDGSNVTLGDTTYLAFVEAGQVELSQNFAEYRADQNRVDYYHERVSGLWAVSILGSLAAVFLTGAAYLPSRY